MIRAFIAVEYDKGTGSGQLSGLTETILLPSECARSDKLLHKAFQKKTGLTPAHIVHFSPRELFDVHGEPLSCEK